MTKKRDLKRLVRERQARTGESYVTARRHVLAQAAKDDRLEPPVSPAANEDGAVPPVVQLATDAGAEPVAHAAIDDRAAPVAQAATDAGAEPVAHAAIDDRAAPVAQAATDAGAAPVAQSLPEVEPADTGLSIPVVEMISLTEQGAQLGLKCRITMASPLASQVNPITALTRLRDVLVASAHDPGLALLRGVVLHGEGAPPPPLPRGRTMWQQEVRRFIERARAGIGGVSETGSMIALNVDGLAGSVLLIAHVGFRPFVYPKPTTAGPRLVLTTVQELTMGPGAGAIMMAP